MRLNYDEMSPITGNMSVMVEYDIIKNQNMKICMESGYHTFESWKEGSEELDAFLSVSPDLIKDSKFIDENKNVWLRIIMMNESVVLSPDKQQEENDWCVNVWLVSSFKFLEEGEEPNPSMVSVKVGDRYKILDPETVSIFGEFEFTEATLEFYKRVNALNEEE